MDHLEIVRAQFAARLEAIRQGRGGRMQPLERWSAPRQSLANDSVSGAPSHNDRPLLTPRLELTTHPILNRLDQIFLRLFPLHHYWRAPLAPYPTYICETLPEFLLPQLEGADLSATQKTELLTAWQAESETLARQSNGRSGVFGVNLPGQGCYLNGWLFNYGRGGKVRDCLDDPAILPRLLETAAHEKWGHGLITDHTALGCEKKAIGLHFTELAARYQHRLVDTPQQALLIERYNLIHRVSELTEEGWATWVENVLAAALLNHPPAPRYELREIWTTIPAPGFSAVQEQARSVLHILFQASEPTWADLHDAILSLQGQGAHGLALRSFLDERFVRAFGQPTPYVVGYLLLDQIARRLGAACAPVAVLLAENLSFDLPRAGLTDLERLVQNPRFNPDSRLAALSRLALSTPGDVAGLVLAARERLNLAAPDPLTASGD